jgi:hypothetical protein
VLESLVLEYPDLSGKAIVHDQNAETRDSEKELRANCDSAVLQCYEHEISGHFGIGTEDPQVSRKTGERLWMRGQTKGGGLIGGIDKGIPR